MQQVCNQLFIAETRRPVIKQGQEELCRACICALTDDTFGEEEGTPLQALVRFHGLKAQLNSAQGNALGVT